MPVTQRILSIKVLGMLLTISIASGLQRSFKFDEISYEIVSRTVAPHGVFLRFEGNKAIICASSLKEVKDLLKTKGIDTLPGQLPCSQFCTACGGSCLAYN